MKNNNFFRYPVGTYRIYVLSQIDEIITIHPSDGTLRKKDGSELFGIVKAILIPPEDFLPYFAHNFGSQEKPDRIYCVCFSCANKTNLDFCYHKEEVKRAITITTSVAELNYAIKEKNTNYCSFASFILMRRESTYSRTL